MNRSPKGFPRQPPKTPLGEVASPDEEIVLISPGSHRAADVTAASVVASAARYNHRLEASEGALRSAEATARDLARRLEEALGREDELVRRLRAKPIASPTSQPTQPSVPASPSEAALAAITAAATASATARASVVISEARAEVEASMRDAEGLRAEIKRLETASSTRLSLAESKAEEATRETAALRSQLKELKESVARSAQVCPLW